MIRKRRAQLGRKIDEIVNRERLAESPVLLAEQNQHDLTLLKQQGLQLGERYEKLELSLRSAQGSSLREAASLDTETALIGNRSVSEAYALLTRVEKWLRDSPSVLSKLNKQLIAQITDDCNALNLRMDEIDLSSRLWHATSNLHFETAERTRRVRSEQPGVWGKVKRLIFPDWGVDERAERWTEIADPEAFKAMIRGATQREKVHIEQFVAASIQRINAVRGQFMAEIANQKRGIQSKMASAAGMVQRMAVARQLTLLQVMPKIGRESETIHHRPVLGLRIDEVLQEIEVDTAAVSLTRLASQIARRRFLDVRNQILDGLSVQQPEHRGRILILGFDHESLSDFVNRFWFDMMESDADRPPRFASVRPEGGGIDEISVACLNGINDSAHRSVRAFLSSPCVLFLLIDIQQIGSSENLLIRSGILTHRNKHSIVAVVQSIKELEQSNSIAEAFTELQAMTRRQQLSLAGVLVNGNEVFHSLLANWLLASPRQLQRMADETQLMKSLPYRARKDAAEIVRSWKELTCPVA